VLVERKMMSVNGIKYMEIEKSPIQPSSHFEGETPSFALPQTHDLTSTSTTDDSTHSGVPGATFNFVNSIVGAGIIGMPYAIKQCGLLMGVALLVFVAYIVHLSVLMLISVGINEKIYNYEELAHHLFGKRGYYITVGAMFTFAYGAMIAYLVIVGDTAPHVLNYILSSDKEISREIVIFTVSLFIILPISLMRDLSSLSSTSLLSIIADVVLLLIIAINGKAVAHNTNTTYNSSDNTIITFSIFAGVGTMSFAFVCQHNSFIIYNTIINPTYDKWKQVVYSSIGIALSLCLGVALGGYFSFGSYTIGDVLNNFPQSGGYQYRDITSLILYLYCHYI
jgi:sodium-coupled neutral amino acid transporter 11